MSYGVKDLYQYSPLLKSIVFLAFVYHFSLFGIPIYWLFAYIYEWLNRFLFNLVPVKGGDRMFLFWGDLNKFNIVATFMFESKFNLNEFKEKFLLRVKNIERLRSMLVKKNLDIWWKVLSYKEAINLLEFREIEVEINNLDEVQNHVFSELKVFDDYENKLPYAFIVLKNKNKDIGDVLLFKFDHYFTDGLGYISLLFGIADNFNVADFPGMLKFNRWEKIKAYLLCPIYIALSFYRGAYELLSDQSPFKPKKMTGNFKYGVSKRHSFSEISSYAKKCSVTFNDLMISVVSNALNKYLEENKDKFGKYNVKTLLLQNTIGTRGFPKSHFELNLENDSTALACSVPLIKDIFNLQEIKEVSRNTKKYLKDFSMAYAVRLFLSTLLTYLPNSIFRYMINMANHDMVYTNLPGPKKPLFYSGNKLEEFLLYTTPGFYPFLTGISSYSNKFRVACCIDDCLGLEPSIISSKIDSVLDLLSKKASQAL